MARGNWSRYKPRICCRYCGAVIKGAVSRVGVYPCHTTCATKRGLIPNEADPPSTAETENAAVRNPNE